MALRVEPDEFALRILQGTPQGDAYSCSQVWDEVEHDYVLHLGSNETGNNGQVYENAKYFFRPSTTDASSGRVFDEELLTAAQHVLNWIDNQRIPIPQTTNSRCAAMIQYGQDCVNKYAHGGTFSLGAWQQQWQCLWRQWHLMAELATQSESSRFERWEGSANNAHCIYHREVFFQVRWKRTGDITLQYTGYKAGSPDAEFRSDLKGAPCIFGFDVSRDPEYYRGLMVNLALYNSALGEARGLRLVAADVVIATYGGTTQTCVSNLHEPLKADIQRYRAHLAEEDTLGPLYAIMYVTAPLVENTGFFSARFAPPKDAEVVAAYDDWYQVFDSLPAALKDVDYEYTFNLRDGGLSPDAIQTPSDFSGSGTHPLAAIGGQICVSVTVQNDNEEITLL